MALNLKIIKIAGMFAIAFAISIKLLQLLDMGCSNFFCSIDGYHYGLRLFLAFLFLASIGWIFISKLQMGIGNREFHLFSSIAVGLSILMAYIFARSLFNHLIIDAPISRPEVFAVIAASLILHQWKGKRREPTESTVNINSTHLFISLAILLALCISIADRELPRAMMLSSDPDQHAFWGRQIERFGAIPYQQRSWGSQSFNYPAGSGVVLYIMQLLAGIDQRNSIVVLPILFTFFAALMVTEVLTNNLEKNHLRLTLQFSTLALMAGGLMFPLYSEYAHGEGSARLLSVLFVGLLVIVLGSELTSKTKPSGQHFVLTSLILFSLITLNPANGMMPAVILAAMVIYGWLNKKQRSILLLLPLAGGLALAMLDPYYQHLAGIGGVAPAESLVLNERFTLLRPYGVAVHTLRFYMNESQHFFKSLTALLVETKPALFGILVMFYVATLIAIKPNPKPTIKAALSTIAMLIALYLAYGFAFAFINDRRFYLLGPYFYFSISQYKAMLLVFLMLLIVKSSANSQKPLWLVFALSIFSILPTILLIRGTQEMFLGPRRDYCGSMGCFPNDDKILLKKFQEMTRSGAFSDSSGVTPKVLVPNALSISDIESWIFPVSSARALPHYDVLPAAFYYYQGDSIYGTKSYEKHVCEVFDRKWLLSNGIRYLYLPTERSETCMAGMETLIRTETVIIKQGNAYLLQLNP